MGWYGATPPAELAELPLFTLEAMGLRSLARPAGGVRTLLATAGIGCEVLVGAYPGYLCIWERWSGGGSWNCGRLDAADRRAVKLWALSIVEDDCEVHGAVGVGRLAFLLWSSIGARRQ